MGQAQDFWGLHLLLLCVETTRGSKKKKHQKTFYVLVNNEKINQRIGIRKSRRKGLPFRQVVQGRFH